VRAKVIDAVNQGTMRSGDVVRHYGRADEVTPAERAVFELVRHASANRPILDVGVGGGRTVPPLLAISKDYIGIDNSQPMVDLCRRKFPASRFEIADVRELSRFASGRFGLVVFSCNGLGMVDHLDRMRALREIHRVLARDGSFVFSAHNQRCADHTAGLQWPSFDPTWNVFKLGARVARFAKQAAVGAYNHRRFSKHDVRSPEYSIINDRCHQYATMLYYITLGNQRRQLVDVGFQPDAMAYDLAGCEIATDTDHSSIYYVARK
jgi:SAM-dependent methyltransferase